MTDKKIIVQFTMLTFCIAYLVSGALIAPGQFGFSVHSFVQSFQQFGMNIPFAIYILSPVIVSYIILKGNNKIAGKGHVFMCVLFHTMFNAASPVFGILPMTWAGTIAANAVIILVSIVIVLEGRYHTVTTGCSRSFSSA